MEPTLAFITAQDATSVTISKTQLDTILTAAGITYTPSVNEKHESILAAIILAAQTTLTEANFNSNVNQNIYIAPGFGTTVTTKTGVTNSPTYLVPSVTVNLAKVTSTAISPDDL